MYTVWVDHNLEGWHPSKPLDTVDQCVAYIQSESYGHNTRITRDVEVAHTEVVDDAAKQTWTSAAMRANEAVAAAALNERAAAERIAYARGGVLPDDCGNPSYVIPAHVAAKLGTNVLRDLNETACDCEDAQSGHLVACPLYEPPLTAAELRAIRALLA